jgi:predicted acyl esterase
MRNLTPLLPPKVPRVGTALYVVERDVMVPMRDGVRLATDI